MAEIIAAHPNPDGCSWCSDEANAYAPQCCRDMLTEEHVKHVAAKLAADLRSQLPTIAFKGPSDTDAFVFRRAADNLDNGYQPGGGNTKAAVSRLLRWAAELLDTADADELAARARTGWDRP